jgi:hypothetical protein
MVAAPNALGLRSFMGQILSPTPVLPLVAAFSRYDAALDWAAERCARVFGPPAAASPRFEFRETDYYASSMGEGIKKCFWAFDRLDNPAALADWKLAANEWEDEYARAAGHAESRPLNIDPGYVTLAKLVLASTKDHAHRIYLRDGIYAEVTLYFKDGLWQHRDWTFPDYRREDYQQFFTAARQLIRGRHTGT